MDTELALLSTSEPIFFWLLKVASTPAARGGCVQSSGHPSWGSGAPPQNHQLATAALKNALWFVILVATFEQWPLDPGASWGSGLLPEQ